MARGTALRLDFAVKAIGDPTDPVGSFEGVLSTSALDREDEIIDEGAFEPLPASIPALIDHIWATDGVVGSMVPSYEGGKLIVRGTYASTPDAQRIRTLVAEKHITSMSCGFWQPIRALKDGKRHIVKAELVEGSFCAVPVNREALITSGKSLDTEAKQDAKSLAGSYEDLRQELATAARTLSDGYAYVTATFADHVVFETYVDGDWAHLQCDWTRGADGTITLGPAVPVEIIETVQVVQKSPADSPAAKAATEPTDETLPDLAVLAARVALINSSLI
jgi:HK97 family phage prohead protease